MKDCKDVVHPSAWNDKALRGLVMSSGWMQRKRFKRHPSSRFRAALKRLRKRWQKHWIGQVVVIRVD